MGVEPMSTVNIYAYSTYLVEELILLWLVLQPPCKASLFKPFYSLGKPQNRSPIIDARLCHIGTSKLTVVRYAATATKLLLFILKFLCILRVTTRYAYT